MLRAEVTTPPRGDGPDPLIVYAAHTCGADTILCCGGVQGIGALRYGHGLDCLRDPSSSDRNTLRASVGELL